MAANDADYTKLYVRRRVSSTLVQLRRELSSGSFQSDEARFGSRLSSARADTENWSEKVPDIDGWEDLKVSLHDVLSATHNHFQKKDGQTITYYRGFTESHVQRVILHLERVLAQLGGTIHQDGPDEDVPLRFEGSDLADHLETVALQENQSQYVDFLVSRIRTFLADSRVRPVVVDDDGVELGKWLEDYVGTDDATAPPVTVLDLSMVATDVVHTVAAVVARIVFEALQRYRRLTGNVLPTVLVMEEAHTFIRRYSSESEPLEASAICCRVFEKIAREGRKFGLGLVLSSQRPSELSPTVLSQCNTFLLHRISNDRDQELVGRLVPDNLRGLLRELPSLPSQHAILLGWASQLPVLTRIRSLPEHYRPHLNDPDYWNVWTKQDETREPVHRPVDWQKIAREWQGRTK